MDLKEIIRILKNLLANNILNKNYYNYAVGNSHNAYNVYPLPEFNTLFKVSQGFLMKKYLKAYKNFSYFIWVHALQLSFSY